MDLAPLKVAVQVMSKVVAEQQQELLASLLQRPCSTPTSCPV
jgi:hypothetical protein